MAKIATILYERALFPTAFTSSHSLTFLSLVVWLFWCRHAVLVKSHPFGTTLDLQLSFYHLLCYNSRAHCPLLQCLCTTSVILAGKRSYFVVSSFRCDGKNSPQPSYIGCAKFESIIITYSNKLHFHCKNINFNHRFI